MSKKCSCAGHGDHDPDCSLLEPNIIDNQSFGSKCPCPFGGPHSQSCWMTRYPSEDKDFDYSLKKYIEEVQLLIKQLDEKVSSLVSAAEYIENNDAYDHLQQIHYKLTDCKGQLGAVKYALKKETI